MKPFPLARMGQEIEGEGDVAAPGMGEAVAFDLREHVGHEAVERRRRRRRGLRREPCPAAEQKARAVRRHAPVAQDAPGIGQRPAVGQQGFGQIPRQRFGGDHVAAHRNDAPAQRRREGARIAVGRDHHLPGANAAARRLQVELSRRARDGKRLACGMQLRAGPLRRREQAVEIERGMQLAGPVDDHAARIGVGGHLLALPAARQHDGLRVRNAVQPVDRGRHGLVMRRHRRRHDAAGALIVAVDALAGDDLLHEVERAGGLADHGGRLRLGQALQALAEEIAAAHHAGVAAAGADAELPGFQDRDARAAPCQMQGGGKACIAAADHGDVDCLRRRLLAPDGRRGFPPKGAFAKILMENLAVAHGRRGPLRMVLQCLCRHQLTMR